MLKREIIERMLSSILMLSNDTKSHRCLHSSMCGLTLYRVKRNLDELALAVQAASANQAASMLEPLMVDCGRACRAPKGALICRKGGKRC